MKQTNETKKLKQLKKDAFERLAGTFGFDFEKPFEIAEMYESPTPCRVYKQLATTAEYCKKNAVFVLAVVKSQYFCDLHAARVAGERLTTQTRQNAFYNIFAKTIDYCFSLGGFDNLCKEYRAPRRDCIIRFFAIMQNAEYLTPRKQREFDPLGRFEGYDATKEGHAETARQYNDRARNFYNYKWIHERPYYREKIEIDKSGYILNEYRARLRDRLQEYKKRRNRERAEQIDRAAEVAKMKATADALRLEILRAASMYTDPRPAVLESIAEALRQVAHALEEIDGFETLNDDFRALKIAHNYFAHHINTAREALREVAKP